MMAQKQEEENNGRVLFVGTPHKKKVGV